jgi:diaminopropionate ammonia-lyase
MARFVANPFRRDEPDWSAPELAYTAAIGRKDQLSLHRQLPGYAPTPLRDCPAMARELGLGRILVKDEAGRFGIDAFKGLGASYAIFQVLGKRWRERTGSVLDPAQFADPAVRERLGTLTFTAATDGNHGRAVAWTAGLLGHAAVIFMPEDTALSRIASIEREGAVVELVPGTFDDCVSVCAETAATRGWIVIADTAYPGNMQVPGYIMTGYSTIFAEIDEQAAATPFDVVLLPAGVGGLAAAGTASLVLRRGAARPRLVCVEPDEAACFIESILHGGGEPIAAAGNMQSIMVGLCCGMPSLLAWPVVRDGMDLFLAIEDDHVPAAMRLYHRHAITSGESGSSTLAGLLALLQRPELAPARDMLRLGSESSILLINTEGATDPENHRRVVSTQGDTTGKAPA